ncbi:hypothetical protein [Novosphingobium sp. FKTRR1]|uniref:hypothetical protein n=1 Tax=unclassified Novosphingobium TaxID=2644732 RepID=UPI001CF039EA|nr:hypothetical protein [Novosphingobium sp. FKTRR1]
MTIRPTALVSITAALLLTGACAAATGGTSAAGNDGHRADVPAARPTGAPVSCISLGQISESRVRDDWTIDFRVGVRKWYRVNLPNRCSGLGFERAFSYATSLSQLCSTDIITVIQQGGGGAPRGSCGLGQFQPVELAK